MKSDITEEASAKISTMGVVCAFLVLFIHLPLDNDASDSAKWIHSFFAHGIGKMAVPFSFIASGYLLAGHFGEDGWYRRAVAKRVRTLWLPMILWSLLYFLRARMALPIAAIILAGRPLAANVALLPTWTEIARILAIHPFQEPYLGVFWFALSRHFC